ncbi:energy transducer TonB [Spirosoma lituiforme]
MKRSVSTWLLLAAIALSPIFFGTNVAAQAQNGKVYTIPERQPEFPGGKAALSTYLAETIRVPNSVAKKSYDTGPISARFIIDELGYVHDIRITMKPLDKKTLKNLEGFMTNIISSIEKMPRWVPGEVGGKHVSVFYTLPIEISLR